MIKFYVYMSPCTKEWFWQARSPNGRILADGGDGFKRRRDCIRAVRNFTNKLNLGWTLGHETC